MNANTWGDNLGVAGLLVVIGPVIFGMFCIAAIAAVCRKALSKTARRHETSIFVA